MTIQVEGEGFLRLPEVLNRFPISKATWHRGIQEGKYPKPVKLSARTVAWRSSDIDALIEQVSTQGEQADASPKFQ